MEVEVGRDDAYSTCDDIDEHAHGEMSVLWPRLHSQRHLSACAVSLSEATNGHTAIEEEGRCGRSCQCS